jgi:hypothetical protein
MTRAKIYAINNRRSVARIASVTIVALIGGVAKETSKSLSPRKIRNPKKSIGTIKKV